MKLRLIIKKITTSIKNSVQHIRTIKFINELKFDFFYHMQKPMFVVTQLRKKMMKINYTYAPPCIKLINDSSLYKMLTYSKLILKHISHTDFDQNVF